MSLDTNPDPGTEAKTPQREAGTGEQQSSDSAITMSADSVITAIQIPGDALQKIASGKVRDLFKVDAESLLFVATDRISAYDVVLQNGVPDKGALLTQLSAFWFSLINRALPEQRTHLISTALPSAVPAAVAPQLARRSLHVRRHAVVPLESIVRGYLTGSAWSEYRARGTVHGMAMPAGLRESEKLPAPLWTPSTKAEAGQHDENISRERAVELVGAETARKVEEASLRIYQLARDYAESRGIIIADTKFEFGLDKASGEVVLIDEVLTPDSSRFWPADEYEVGKSQRSYDKQYLRDWLTNAGLKGKDGVSMPAEVVAETARKYREAYEKLTDRKWE